MKAMYNSSIEAAVKRKPDSSAAKKKRPPKILPDASHGTSEPFYLVDGKTSWPTTPPSQGTKRPQYLRRTLDQFYYPALDDTSARDGDQTISKWSGTPLKHNGRDKAVPDSAMIMVDQFWCWIIDEKTIITSFPGGVFSASFTGLQDLYWSITKSLSHDPQQLRTVKDMYSLLVKEAAGYMFNQVNRSSVDMIEIYRWVTSKKAATQTTYFQEFQRGYASSGRNETIGKDDPIFNNRSDLNLILEVADIIDELKLLDLSDLKSKAASLAEAHASLEAAQSSAKEAQAASTQGRAVMLFTIITVVFLPLSFFTSYFGQNVKELTGDDDNPSTWHLWRVATPITVVIIVVALVVAYYITQPSSSLWTLIGSTKKGSLDAERTNSPETAHAKWWKKNPFSLLQRLREWKHNRPKEQDLEKNGTDSAKVDSTGTDSAGTDPEEIELEETYPELPDSDESEPEGLTSYDWSPWIRTLVTESGSGDNSDLYD
ncbi:hypothetical protein AA0119_g7495 [Alternaria tenuissima]|nr:hypothetical protein AA0115_g10525 [Alternaria tenuissima]RYN97346.1 hypothetical protein AA0119_g7495 [Alternaria tenuissima]RYO20607.1 hypothetical protein AA0121_g3366 [Alternaria tenuissima]